MSTAILPTMSHQLAAGKLDEMKHTFGFALRIVSFITIPAAVGLVLLRRPIIQVLFQHGRFVAESTSLTANALLYYALGLPAFAAIKLITPMYYSAQDTMTPARVGAYALGANVRVERGVPAVRVSVSLERKSGAGKFARGLFQFCAAVCVFSQALWRAGLRGVAASLGKMAVCAVGDGGATYFALHVAFDFAAVRHLLAAVPGCWRR